MTDQWTPTPVELADLELLSIGAWPSDLPFHIDLPDDLSDTVELLDPEGLPLAKLDVASGEVTPLAHPQFGPFRRHHRPPAEVRREHPDAVAVLVRNPPSVRDVERVRERVVSTSRTPVVLVTTGPNRRRRVSAPALVRAAAAAFPGDVLVATAVAEHAGAGEDDFARAVAQTYADEVLELEGEGELPDAVAAIVDADRPPSDRRGLVVFLTGLSGSGKSTLARALHDVVLERGERTVTSLDGDVVRHHLSKGLGFSREDRETNIARIGWVAAEIARHHGMAICSPIAPFAATRAQVRAMVEEAGGRFALVHVATPLAECERRDRKGLYAKARAGLIPEFTGISSPYEEPDDALVGVDTTGRTVDDALAEIVDALRAAGLWGAS